MSSETLLFADVALAIPRSEPLTYEVPAPMAAQIAIGCRAKVPVGFRQMLGVVVRLRDKSGFRCRPISELLDAEPAIDAEMLQLTDWVGQRYLCSWGEAIRAALPLDMGQRRVMSVQLNRALDPRNFPAPLAEIISYVKRRPGASVEYISDKFGPQARLHLKELERLGLAEISPRWTGQTAGEKLERWLVWARDGDVGRRSPQRLKDWELLRQRREVRSSELPSPKAAEWLVCAGLARWESRPVTRFPGPPALKADEVFELTGEQREALGSIVSDIDAGQNRVHLLFGVTSSGKTEVYLRAATEAAARGRQSLVLVPEIGLIPQMVARMQRRFDRVGVWHSELSQGERVDTWREMRRGGFQVVVGVRSAVFAPLPRLGLVVVDEEHDSSYKQQETDPRYHARTVALERARRAGAAAILGSATPSVESFALAQAGKYALHFLSHRIGQAQMPTVEIVDVRQAPADNVLAPQLRQALRQRMESGQQAMLLLNRRGFAPSVQCRRCGELVRCPNCSIGLTYHRAGERMLCHYCGYRARLADACPACGEASLATRGAGIQRLEQELLEAFPSAPLLRMDADTTGRKGAHDRLLRKFQQGEARILIGTQMIAKGHHFPEVTLAGILNMDDVAGLPDFRSSERAMQLVWQMAGRAGRGDQPGTVMVQTRMASLPMLGMARAQDYRRFLESELEARRQAGYPPYVYMVLITVAAGTSDAAEARASAIGRELAAMGCRPEVLGPAPAPIHKLRSRFRWQLLAKHENREALAAACRSTRSLSTRVSGTSVSVDVEPVSTL